MTEPGRSSSLDDERVEELASVLFANDTSDLADPGWDDYAYEAYMSQARAALDWMSAPARTEP